VGGGVGCGWVVDCVCVYVWCVYMCMCGGLPAARLVNKTSSLPHHLCMYSCRGVGLGVSVAGWLGRCVCVFVCVCLCLCDGLRQCAR